MATLKEFLAKPFGPWPDSVVLAKTFKSTKTRVKYLTNVQLIYDGRYIGLTNCEPSMSDYVERNRPIQVRGVLEIKKLSDLSEEGRRLLQDAIRRRNPRFTLAGIYANRSPATRDRDLNAKVTIEGVKQMAVVYLTGDMVPNGLYLKTSDCQRFYEVVTMDPRTYAKSSLYFSRYRALRVLRDVCDYDAATSGGPTPLASRTPEWFSRMYIRYVDNAYDNDEAAIHLSSDSETEDSSVRPNFNRARRSTSRSAVEQLLLRHRRWLIDDQGRTRPSSRFFDIDIWRRWTRRIRDTESASPIPHSPSPSPTPAPLPEPQPAPQPEVDDLEDMYAELDPVPVKDEENEMDIDIIQPQDEDDELPEYQSPSPPPVPEMGNNRKGKRKASPESDDIPLPSPALQREEAYDDDDYDDDGDDWDQLDPSPVGSPTQIQDENYRGYDEDFSPASTPDWLSGSDDDPANRSPTPPSPTLLATIPHSFFHPPKLPGFSFKWYCPVEDCTHLIDLLSLSDENRQALHRQDVRRLERGGWNLGDEWVLKCFGAMVSKHWTDHLNRLGIQVQKVNGKTRVKWKHPESHPSTQSKSRSQTIKREKSPEAIPLEAAENDQPRIVIKQESEW